MPCNHFDTSVLAGANIITSQVNNFEAFRIEVRDFLARELTPELQAAAQQGFSISREAGSNWHSKLFRAGWIAPSWPVSSGGTGWSAPQQHIFSEECALAGAPMIMPFAIGMVGPVIYTYGSDEQKKRHIPGILDGSVWWCQGYSEPGSGSDLASLKTRATRDGDDYVVNGQKIWTTNAHKADWIFALVRTDQNCKPQQGISFLLIDMSTPGIEIKPIVSIDGLHHLNEVYFTDVRVSVSNRVGEENKGWTYAKFLLGHERTGIAGVANSRRAVQSLRNIGQIESNGNGQSLLSEDGFARRLDKAEITLESLAATEARILAEMERSGSAGDAASMLKVIGTELQQELESLRVEAVAYYALPFNLAHVRGESNDLPIGPDHSGTAISDYNFGRASTIYGGSNEIQRNVIAKALLGLP